MANVSSSNGLEKRPKLRFPGFGEPYVTTTLGNISTEVKRTDSKSTAPVMMLSAGNGFIMQSDKYSRDNAGQSLKKYILLKKGELAYNHGASKAKQYGCCYELTQDEARIPYVYHCFKLTGTHYTPYIALLLNNPKMDQQLKKLVSSSVRMDGLLNISYDEYMSVKINLPEKDEQEKIAKFIKLLDRRIEKQRQLVEALKKYKRGLLSVMFPKNGESVPQYRFRGFSDTWEQRKLGDAVDVRSGRDYKHLSEGDIPVYGTGGYMLSVNEALSYDEDAIGIGRKGTIDKPYVLRAPFWTVDTLFYAVPRENIDLDFVFDIFQNIDWKKKDESTGVPSLSKTVINEIEVLIPKIDEQAVLGRYFANLDRLIALHQRKAELAEYQKQSLMQQLFI